MSIVALPTAARFERAAGAAAFTDDHSALVAALRQEMPDLAFVVGTTGVETFRGNFIRSSDGALVAENASLWIRAQIEQLGSAGAVYEAFETRGHYRTVGSCITYFVTAAVGSGPLDVVQANITAICERPYKTFCGDHAGHCTADGLVFGDGEAPLDDHPPLDDRRYGFDAVSHWRAVFDEIAALEDARRREFAHTRVVRTQTQSGEWSEQGFLEAFPDYLDYETPLHRFARDWTATQAAGPQLHQRWGLEITDYTQDGERDYYAIPCPFDIQQAPRVSSDGSIWQLRERLEAFDEALGYPFAWFFHMVYGNRLGSDVGRRISEAVKAGQLKFTEAQERVLLGWRETPYGF